MSLVEASASKCGEISTIKCVLLRLLGADRFFSLSTMRRASVSIRLSCKAVTWALAVRSWIVCVDAVHVGDNLQLLGQNNVPEEWTDAVGTDGNLENNTLSYIKSGNGIDSVDEIVKTESVKQKLVYATVTYTNKSDEEINHVLYIGTLLLMDHEDGAYQIYDPTEQSGDDYDRVIWDGVARTAEMTYNSISEDYGDGGNYISSLKPGESIQVNMAWIVNENDLNNMYLNLNGDGAAYEFSDSMLKTGLVDIYQ